MGGDPIVLGATSLVGRFLVSRLVEGGASPIAVSRRPPVRTAAEARWIVGDLTAVEDTFQKVSATTVFSASPIWLLAPAVPALIQGGMTRLTAFSSTSRFTKSASPVAEEREVADRLARSEEAVVNLCEKAGVAWTVLRPTLIYAEGLDANVTRLASLIRRLGFLPLCGEGAGLRQPVHADDLAAGAILVASTPATWNRSYNLAGGETLTYRRMAERIFEGLGRRPAVVNVPQPLWTFAFKCLAPLLPGTTLGMGLRMNEDLTFENLEAQRDFGWCPRDFRPDFSRSAHTSKSAVIG